MENVDFNIFIRLDTWDDWATYLLMISDLECQFSKRFKEFRAKKAVR